MLNSVLAGLSRNSVPGRRIPIDSSIYPLSPSDITALSMSPFGNYPPAGLETVPISQGLVTLLHICEVIYQHRNRRYHQKLHAECHYHRVECQYSLI